MSSNQLVKLVYRNLLKSCKRFDTYPILKAYYARPDATHSDQEKASQPKYLSAGKYGELVRAKAALPLRSRDNEMKSDVASELVQHVVYSQIYGDSHFYIKPVQYTALAKSWFRDPRSQLLKSVDAKDVDRLLPHVDLSAGLVMMRVLNTALDNFSKSSFFESKLKRLQHRKRILHSRSGQPQERAQREDRCDGQLHSNPELPGYANAVLDCKDLQPGMCVVSHPAVSGYWGEKIVLLTQQLPDGTWRGVITNELPAMSRHPNLSRLAEAVPMHGEPRVMEVLDSIRALSVPIIPGGNLDVAMQVVMTSGDHVPEARTRLNEHFLWTKDRPRSIMKVLIKHIRRVTQMDETSAVQSHLEDSVRVFVGECVWKPQDLEEEVAQGRWIPANVSPHHVFAPMPTLLQAPERAWQAVLTLFGGEFKEMVEFEGYFTSQRH